MRSIREHPDSEENQRMTRDNQRAVFAAKMQASPERDAEGYLRAAVERGDNIQRDGFYDEWRNRYSVASDGAELFAAWTRAMDSLIEEGLVQL